MLQTEIINETNQYKIKNIYKKNSVSKNVFIIIQFKNYYTKMFATKQTNEMFCLHINIFTIVLLLQIKNYKSQPYSRTDFVITKYKQNEVNHFFRKNKWTNILMINLIKTSASNLKS